MELRIINIYIYSRIRGSKTETPKCIFVIEDDMTKVSKAYKRSFHEAMTGNRLSLAAVIAAVGRLSRPCEVHLHTDSRYVSGAFEEDRVSTWQKQGWINAKGAPVSHMDLWQQVYQAMERHMILAQYDTSSSVYLWMEERMKHVADRQG